MENKVNEKIDSSGTLKEKLWDMEVKVIPITAGTLETVPIRLEQKTGGIGNQKKNRDHLDHKIVKMG